MIPKNIIISLSTRWVRRGLSLRSKIGKGCNLLYFNISDELKPNIDLKCHEMILLQVPQPINCQNQIFFNRRIEKEFNFMDGNSDQQDFPVAFPDYLHFKSYMFNEASLPFLKQFFLFIVCNEKTIVESTSFYHMYGDGG